MWSLYSTISSTILYSYYNLTINVIIIQFLNQRGEKTAIEYETSLLYNIKSIIQ